MPERFVSPCGREVLVGGNAADNCRLTNSADRADVWLHARDASGPHVVLVGPSPGDAALQFAARLALGGRPGGYVTVADCGDVRSSPRGLATVRNARTLRVETLT